MEWKESAFEKEVFGYVDEIKELLSPDMWQNILLDCTKNELFILWLVFREREVNMTQIAEYIHVPLNTATGIITRMEKRELVLRERSAEDKRIVTIRLGKQGEAQIESIADEIMRYGKCILEDFTTEELELFHHMFEKFRRILCEEQQKKNEPKARIRKITIE